MTHQDTEILWSVLEFQPEFTATAANIGNGWWSHDIGGHHHGITVSQALSWPGAGSVLILR